MKIQRNLQLHGMKYSMFVRIFFYEIFIENLQVIREYTTNELASIRTKSAKTSASDIKYQETLKLFKTLIENSNTRTFKSLVQEKYIRIFIL